MSTRRRDRKDSTGTDPKKLNTKRKTSLVQRWKEEKRVKIDAKGGINTEDVKRVSYK